MSLKNIKLIVADLDGTLLHDDKSLDRNIKSVLIERMFHLLLYRVEMYILFRII